MRNQGKLKDRNGGKDSAARLAVALLFAASLAAATLTGALPYLVPLYYLVASLTAFVAYALDKSAAQQDRWRTQESTLHIFSLLGGWPGALIAQQALRHKTQKTGFQVTFWSTVALNLGGLSWLLASEAAQPLRAVARIPETLRTIAAGGW